MIQVKIGFNNVRNEEWDGVNPFYEMECTALYENVTTGKREKDVWYELDSPVRIAIKLHESIANYLISVGIVVAGDEIYKIVEGVYYQKRVATLTHVKK